MSRKILVIEDDDTARALMRITLEKQGYDVTVVADGVRGYDTAVFLSLTSSSPAFTSPALTAFTSCAGFATHPL